MGDLVYRNDVINALLNTEDGDIECQLQAVSNLPSADMWVNCKEAFPPGRMYVLAYNVDLGFPVFAMHDASVGIWRDNTSDNVTYSEDEITYWKAVNLFPPEIKE